MPEMWTQTYFDSVFLLYPLEAVIKLPWLLESRHRGKNINEYGQIKYLSR